MHAFSAGLIIPTMSLETRVKHLEEFFESDYNPESDQVQEQNQYGNLLNHKAFYLMQMGKHKESADFVTGTIIPYYERLIQRARNGGCTGFQLSYYVAEKLATYWVLALIHQNFQDIDRGLEALEEAKALTQKSIKAGELDTKHRGYVEVQKQLDEVQQSLQKEASKRRAETLKKSSKKVAVGLLVVSAVVLVTYGMISVRQRMKN